MKYDLELDNVVKRIKKGKFSKVLIQLPDGLKPEAGSIADRICKDTKADCCIWMGSCYGGCDIPIAKGFDLLVQFGHNRFMKTKEW